MPASEHMYWLTSTTWRSEMNGVLQGRAGMSGYLGCPASTRDDVQRGAYSLHGFDQFRILYGSGTDTGTTGMRWHSTLHKLLPIRFSHTPYSDTPSEGGDGGT